MPRPRSSSGETQAPLGCRVCLGAEDGARRHCHRDRDSQGHKGHAQDLPAELACLQRGSIGGKDAARCPLGGYLQWRPATYPRGRGRQRGAPFIPFKSNTVATTEDSTWGRMYHYFMLKREDFLSHYHRRSNVETVFSMCKAKFGDSVRSKSDTAWSRKCSVRFYVIISAC